MIKKILGYIVVIILVVIGYICIFKGISIGGYNILSYNQMATLQKEYEEKIEKYNVLVDETYQSALERLNNSKSTFESNKNAYEELKAYTSYEDLLELTRDKQYDLEFLWIKLDLVARNNNLDANFTLTNSSMGTSKNIAVTLSGDYLAVKNYIYDILIDLELQFKAEDIVIESNGDTVTARFTVKNIKVVM